jgi:hypothetical protein
MRTLIQMEDPRDGNKVAGRWDDYPEGLAHPQENLIEFNDVPESEIPNPGDEYDIKTKIITRAAIPQKNPDEQMKEDLIAKDPATWTDKEFKQATYLTLKKG